MPLSLCDDDGLLEDMYEDAARAEGLAAMVEEDQRAKLNCQRYGSDSRTRAESSSFAS